KRHVGVATDVAALHASLADAEAASDLTDRREVGLGHLRRAVLGAHDRLRDDLDERNARTVVIDKRARRALDATRGSTDVRQLARVFFHVRALDRNADDLAIFELDLNRALERDRLVELADLVVLTHVGVEVVLAREAARRRDRAVQGEAQADRAADRLGVHDRHRTGQAQVDRRDERVRLGVVELLVRGVARGREHLRLRIQLDVHLEADNRLEDLESLVEVHKLRHQSAPPLSAGALSSSGAPHSSTRRVSRAAETRYRRASSYAGARNWIPTGSPSSAER